MNINLLPFLVVWVALALAVLYLFLRHRSIAGKQDVGLDVLETPAIAQQHAVLAQQQAVIDKWGKSLTAIAAVLRIVVGGGIFLSVLDSDVELWRVVPMPRAGDEGQWRTCRAIIGLLNWLRPAAI